MKLRTLQQSTGWQSTRPQVILLEVVRVYVRVKVGVVGLVLVLGLGLEQGLGLGPGLG